MKAIIDLGTNTFHLLIAEVKQGNINEYFKLQVPVKLGKGGINEGIINEDAFKRGITAIAEFRKYIDQFEIKDVVANATSAIREAKNGDDFVNKVKNDYQINIRKISGDQEAIYIYEGVRNSFNLPGENILVMDIGGGSVEFIIGNRESILWKHSFELGAARLVDKFQKSDPIRMDEIHEINSYIDQNLKLLKDAQNQFPAKILVGSAGSFETLVDVVLKDFGVIPNSLSRHAFEIRGEDFEVFYELMVTSSSAQRSKLKGMVDFRIEMIVVAAILMNYVINNLNIKKIISSEYALKEGMLILS